MPPAEKNNFFETRVRGATSGNETTKSCGLHDGKAAGFFPLRHVLNGKGGSSQRVCSSVAHMKNFNGHYEIPSSDVCLQIQKIVL